MWSDNNWKLITAEQAARLHPGGTISAHSGLFMCELCGQYVTLTDGDVRMRYFKHSAYEKSKDCPERTFGSSYPVSFNSWEYDLPIRITSVSSSSFRFEVGLIRVPISLFNKNFRIEIKPKGAIDVSYVFTRERLNCDGITYLPIGERPFENYILNFQNGNDRLREFWPEEIRGIDPNGTLFEKASGKKLSYDADVEIGREYYLLKRGYIYRASCKNVQIQEVTKKQFGWETWTLYVVSVSVYDENTARFYLDFHCRLTDCPVSLQPVWPLFVEGNYLVKHNQSNMYVFVEGNITSVKTFPAVSIQKLSSNTSRQYLYKIFCSSRQQLISAGRTRVLQYTNFWKEPLNQIGLHPDILVTDSMGCEVTPGETDILPHNKTLRFMSLFDGELILSRNNRIVNKQKVCSDKQIELEGLSYGMSVQVVIGLDVIWQIDFKKRQPIAIDDESVLLGQISISSGRQIPIPHALRNILISMNCYPKIDQWIRKCLKRGTIDEQAYRRLQETYRDMKTNR